MNDRIVQDLLRATLFGGALTAAAMGAGCTDDEAACDPSGGNVCSIAGTGAAGYLGDDGPATGADLYLPMDAAYGPDGLLYIVDWNNHRLRSIDANGDIHTVAGTGRLGDGPNGNALEHDFNHPTDILFDAQGRIIIAAWHNSKLKRFDPAAGTVEDICGTGRRAYSGDDGPAPMADLDLPASLAFHPDGRLFVMDQANQVIRFIDSADTIHRFAGQCIIGERQMGEELVQCEGTNKLTTQLDENPMACAMPCTPSFGGDGGPADELRMAQPFGQQADPAGHLVFDAQGNLYFADTKNNRIRRIDAESGEVTTYAGTGEAGFAGDGGAATEAQLNNPVDLVFDAAGTLYVTDTMSSCVRAIDPDGTIRTAVGICGQRGFEGDGGPATEALLDRPYGLAMDREGNLLVIDTHNHRLRLVGLATR
ncbi:MAG: hypothetical protein IT379_22315 [Deltaproteobacteria bacterium]|nr:hypothetical protein [Deltaproteobacteria bacterium]